MRTLLVASALATCLVAAFLISGCGTHQSAKEREEKRQEDIQERIDKLKHECSDPKDNSYAACQKVKRAVKAIGLCNP